MLTEEEKKRRLLSDFQSIIDNTTAPAPKVNAPKKSNSGSTPAATKPATSTKPTTSTGSKSGSAKGSKSSNGGSKGSGSKSGAKGKTSGKSKMTHGGYIARQAYSGVGQGISGLEHNIRVNSAREWEDVRRGIEADNWLKRLYQETLGGGVDALNNITFEKGRPLRNAANLIGGYADATSQFIQGLSGFQSGENLLHGNALKNDAAQNGKTLEEQTREYQKQLLGNNITNNVMNLEQVNSKLDAARGDMPLVVRGAGDIANTIGALTPAIATTALTRNPMAGRTVMAGSAAGNQMADALGNGADLNEAIRAGNASGAVEWGSEGLFSGMKAMDVGDGLITKGAVALAKRSLPQETIDNIVRLAKTPGGQWARWFLDRLGEGLEEDVAEAARPGIEGIYKNKGAIDPVTGQSLLKAGGLGAAVSAVVGGSPRSYSTASTQNVSPEQLALQDYAEEERAERQRQRNANAVADALLDLRNFNLQEQNIGNQWADVAEAQPMENGAPQFNVGQNVRTFMGAQPAAVNNLTEAQRAKWQQEQPATPGQQGAALIEAGVNGGTAESYIPGRKQGNASAPTLAPTVTEALDAYRYIASNSPDNIVTNIVTTVTHGGALSATQQQTALLLAEEMEQYDPETATLLRRAVFDPNSLQNQVAPQSQAEKAPQQAPIANGSDLINRALGITSQQNTIAPEAETQTTPSVGDSEGLSLIEQALQGDTPQTPTLENIDPKWNVPDGFEYQPQYTESKWDGALKNRSFLNYLKKNGWIAKSSGKEAVGLRLDALEHLIGEYEAKTGKTIAEAEVKAKAETETEADIGEYAADIAESIMASIENAQTQSEAVEAIEETKEDYEVEKAIKEALAAPKRGEKPPKVNAEIGPARQIPSDISALHQKASQKILTKKEQTKLIKKGGLNKTDSVDLLWTVPKDYGGWMQVFNGENPTYDALRITDPELFQAFKNEAESDSYPITNLYISIWDYVRQAQFSPMAAAQFLSNLYKTGGIEAFEEINNGHRPLPIGEIKGIDARHAKNSTTDENFSAPNEQQDAPTQFAIENVSELSTNVENGNPDALGVPSRQVKSQMAPKRGEKSSKVKTQATEYESSPEPEPPDYYPETPDIGKEIIFRKAEQDNFADNGNEDEESLAITIAVAQNELENDNAEEEIREAIKEEEISNETVDDIVSRIAILTEEEEEGNTAPPASSPTASPASPPATPPASPNAPPASPPAVPPASPAGDDDVITRPMSQTRQPRHKLTPSERKKTLREYWDDLYRKITNSTISIDRLDEGSGQHIFRNFVNRVRMSNGMAQQAIGGDYQTDFNGKPMTDAKGNVVPSIGKIFDSIRDEGEEVLRDFYDYLRHYRNVDALTSGSGEFVFGYKENDRNTPRVSLADSNKRIAAYEQGGTVEGRQVKARPEFKKLAEQVWAYNHNLLLLANEAGIISDADLASLEATHPRYVPNFRDKDMLTANHFGSLTSKPFVESGGGGTSDFLPLEAAMAYQTANVYKHAFANMLGIKMAEGLANGDFPANGPVQFADEGQVNSSPLNTPDIEAFASEDIPIEFQWNRGQNGTLTVHYKDGTHTTLILSSGIAEGIHALVTSSDLSRSMGTLGKVIQGAVNGQKALATTYNVAFMVTNFLRDQAGGLIYTKDLGGYFKNFGKAMKEMRTGGDIWKQYCALGGPSMSFFDANAGEIDTQANKILRKRENIIGNVAEAPFRTLEVVNFSIEQLPRFIEFMNTLEQTGDVDQALYDSADITVNFGRSGSFGRYVNRMVPFFNAGVQGLDKFIRTMGETKSGARWARMAVVATLSGIAPEIINELRWKDDEDYQHLPLRSKANNLILFKTQDGKFVRIPKGRVQAVMAAMTDVGINISKGEDLQFDEMVKAVMENSAPANPLENNVLYSAARADLFNPDSKGKTWYGGDIESDAEHLAQVAPGLRADETTSTVFSKLGEKTNLSPKKMQDIFKSYTGGMGDMIIAATTPQAEANYVERKFALDPVYSNDYSSDFYERYNQAKQDSGEKSPLSQKEKDIANAMERYFSDYVKETSDYRDRIDNIQNNGGGLFESKESKEHRRSKSREIRSGINAIYDKANAGADAYEDALQNVYNEAAAEAQRTGFDIVDMLELYVNRELNGSKAALQSYNKQAAEKADKVVSGSEYIDYDTYFDAYMKKQEFEETYKASDGRPNATQVNEAMRNWLFSESGYSPDTASALDEGMLSDYIHIPKDVSPDYSAPDMTSFKVSQYSEAKQDAWARFKKYYSNISLESFSEDYDAVASGKKVDHIAYIQRKYGCSYSEAANYRAMLKGNKGW